MRPLRIERDADPVESSRMTLVEHLAELRGRVIKSAVALILGVGVAFFFFRPIFAVLIRPYCGVPAHLRTTVASCQLVYFGVLDGFLVRMQVSLFVGALLAAPIWLYQLWAFVTPGLHRRERRFALPFVLASIGLFLAGAAFAYFTLDKGLTFLLGFSGPHLRPFLAVDRYLSFFLLMLVAFGVSFEFPILLIFLQLAGLLNSTKLRKWRRGSYFGVAVFAAVITPSQDPFTFLAMAIPMGLFYEAAVLFGRLRERSRSRRLGSVDDNVWSDDETSPI